MMYLFLAFHIELPHPGGNGAYERGHVVMRGGSMRNLHIIYS